MARGGRDAAAPGLAAGTAAGEAGCASSCFALLADAATGEPAASDALPPSDSAAFAGNGPPGAPLVPALPPGLALQLLAGASQERGDAPAAPGETAASAAGQGLAEEIAAWIGERPSAGGATGEGVESFAAAVAAWIGERPSPAGREADGTGPAEADAIADPLGAASDAILPALVAAGTDAPDPAVPVLDPAAVAAAVVPASAAPPGLAAAAPAAEVQAVGAADAIRGQAAPSPGAPSSTGSAASAGADAGDAAAEAGTPRQPEQEGAPAQAGSGEVQPHAEAAAASRAAAARTSLDADVPAGASPGSAPEAQTVSGPAAGPQAGNAQRETPAMRAGGEPPAIETARPESAWSAASVSHGAVAQAQVPHGSAAPPPHAAAQEHALPVVQNVPVSAVAVEIGVKSLAGVNRFEIRLDPPELGRVEVRLEIDEAGAVQARLVVDRVETLALLQREARTLERAFEQAGLKPSEGGIDLTLRDPQADSRGQQRGDERGHRGEPHRTAPPRAEAEAGEGPAPQPIRTVWRLAGGVDRRV